MNDKDRDAPLTLRTLDDAAVATHEMFQSYMRAGFTRQEALQLVMGHLADAQARLERGKE